MSDKIREVPPITDETYKALMVALGMPNNRSLLSALQQIANHATQRAAWQAAQAVQATELEAQSVPEGMITLPASDHRITVDEEGVPTIMLGCGGFVISDVYSAGLDYAGVCFELRAEPREVGTPDLSNYGKSSGSAGAFLKIVSTRPESLLVLINELQQAVDGFGTLPPAAPKEGEL